MKALKWTLAVAVLLATVSSASADVTYGFYDFRNHNTANSATGAAQFFMDVSWYATGKVLFTLRNTGPNASSITHVYFDDGSLLALAAVLDDGVPPPGNPEGGVYFSQDVDMPQNPPDLPGGENIGFETSRYPAESGKKQKFDMWAAGAEPPPAIFGINPGESLGVVFDLQNVSATDISSVIAALLDGSLRVGLHAQDMENVEGYGDSESFVNCSVPVPAPGAALLGAIGVGVVGWLKRRLS